MWSYDLSGVEDQRVIDAVNRVDRAHFVPEELKGSAYYDGPLPIGSHQTISQPSLVAMMTQYTLPRSEAKILEIGTGSGYQAAILGEVFGEVYTTEIIQDLAEEASERLERLGYDNVHVKHSDGYDGWIDEAPFDAILITASAPEFPDELLDQLKDGGRMVYPLGKQGGVQELVITIKKDGKLKHFTAGYVRFVPMTGRIMGHTP
ncbi:protein-L-isoaspartate(D-aspartate) O-methyltransferase [Limisalsivibrio acetivorans]|uniref:protein-L-isoaspartate(D-aspartate) O-methyltransferase n=1 Tax=Limisalsivibrio acetivorans TaxID=1304888 RepID=UPI0003B665CC|nr:protein-L-isoaspartate(D-aspartate) O-methyltransferase [Limisalsivibrio acetivorans]